MSKPQEQEAPRLRLRDRMDYPYIIQTLLLNFSTSVKEALGEFSEQEIIEAAKTIYNFIPDKWRDDEFTKNLKDAEKTIIVDVRREWCGRKLSMEYCEENKIPVTKEYVNYDYWMLLHACINLLQRRGYTSKPQYTEIFTGIPGWKEKTQIVEET